jgi:hypothetical protein
MNEHTPESPYVEDGLFEAVSVDEKQSKLGNGYYTIKFRNTDGLIVFYNISVEEAALWKLDQVLGEFGIDDIHAIVGRSAYLTFDIGVYSGRKYTSIKSIEAKNEPIGTRNPVEDDPNFEGYPGSNQ